MKDYILELLNKVTDNIKVVEWIVAQILNISYEEVKGKCIVKDSRTTRASNSDKIKYVDIKDLNVISRFEEYPEEKVPLLEDVLKWAKDKDFILNIELKPMDDTLLLTDKVVEMVHQYKMDKKVIIASFDVPSILRVKELDDKLKIVYLGNTYQYNELFDYYSINYSGLTTAVVDKIHKNDKKVFAWTINDPKLVKSLLYMNVDNIITNDPIMVKEVIDKYKDRNKVTVLFDFILNI